MTSLRKDGSSADADAAALAMLGASPLPAFILASNDAAGTISFANSAILALTGHAPDELVGHALTSLQSRHGDPTTWARLRETVAAREAGAAELLCVRKDGTSFWGEFHIAPLPDGPLLVQLVDITRRRDAEDALRLSQQREALGLLTNSVAHEFNNFLQILIGYIDGLKRRLGDRPEPFIQRALIRSTEASERAAILTRQLLTHSRRIAPEVRPVDVTALLNTIGDDLSRTLPPRVQLDVSAAPGLPPALCNPTQVELAMRYIVANAVEAMAGDGRVEIAAFPVPPGDRAIYGPGDGAVTITVRDNGQGMSPEMATRALVPFTTSREAGRGVGLAIVHGLMKRQNGTITLDSRPGEGTTVRLVFPAAA